MPGDLFYQSPEWRALRAACLKRDGYRCTVEGCATPTYRLTADHIKPRREGGQDWLPNLRTLCGHHDAQVKEQRNGTRRNGGKPRVVGCDASGAPLDPQHLWNRPKGLR